MGYSASLRRSGVVASLWLIAASAWADPYHYQIIPLGERAIGMGGAFTGVASDPSATYYNPAGLTRLEDSTLSASLTLTALDKQKITRGYRTAEGSNDLTHTATPSLPVFVGIVQQLGRRRADGYRRHALALSSFTLEQRRLSFDAEIDAQVANGRAVETFSLQEERSIIWNGLSYAYRISDRLSWGFSGFLSVQRWRHREERLTVTLGERDPNTGTYANPTTALDTRRTGSDVRNIVLRMGVLYAPKPKLRVGVMLQFPSLKVSGKSSVNATSVFTYARIEPAYSTFVQSAQSNLRADWPLPWEFRVGTSYQLTSRITAALDVSVYGRIGSKTAPQLAVGKRPIDPETKTIPSAGEVALETYYAKPTGNVAIGGEGIIGIFVVRGGFFTDLSSSPFIPKRSDRYLGPDVNHYGLTTSAGIFTSGYDISLGLTLSFGKGAGLAYTPAAEAPYTRTTVQDRTLFVFVSGAKRTLTKLAKVTATKLSERSDAAAAEEEKAAQGEPRSEPQPVTPGGTTKPIEAQPSPQSTKAAPRREAAPQEPRPPGATQPSAPQRR